MKKNIRIYFSKGLDDAIKWYAKDEGYVSKSDFVYHIIKEWIEKEIVKELRESKREFASGKGIKLNSLKDLD